MKMNDATKLIHPELFRINIINCSKGAGATTLLQTMGKTSDKEFHMDENFSVCVVKHQGENIHLQVWDDSTLAREKMAASGTDVELFLIDPTDENTYDRTLTILSRHTTQNPARTLRILVANKADTLNAEDLQENTATLETLANQFNFDSCALISATSTSDVKDLVSDITTAAVNMRNYFKNEDKLREKMIAEIRSKITDLTLATGFLTNKALNDAKKIGLSQLATALLKKNDTPIATIIADIRTEHPKLDGGTVSQNTKAMLDRFVTESEALSTDHPRHEEEKSSTSSHRYG